MLSRFFMSEKRTIKEWSENDRPREKLLTQGPENLSDAELIAILFRVGVGASGENPGHTALGLAIRLLDLAQNDLNRLAKIPVKEITRQIKGIGEAKAITLIAGLELGRRRLSREAAELPTIRESKDIYLVLKSELGHLEHEESWLILLNRANRIIYSSRFSMGGIAGTVVDVRRILRKALEISASGIIIAHNHPSGNLSPSSQDKTITQKLNEAATIMEMKLLDHLIITHQKYFSFADEGLL